METLQHFLNLKLNILHHREELPVGSTRNALDLRSLFGAKNIWQQVIRSFCDAVSSAPQDDVPGWLGMEWTTILWL
jgi:hypothetical protein